MRLTASMVLLAGLTLACSAQAGESAQQEDVDLYFNGVKVAIDPATGRLRQPTPAEIKALRATVQQMPTARGKAMPATRADAQRTLRKRADGTVRAQVSEDMMLSLEATRQADGTIKITHAGDAAAHEEAGHE